MANDIEAHVTSAWDPNPMYLKNDHTRETLFIVGTKTKSYKVYRMVTFRDIEMKNNEDKIRKHCIQNLFKKSVKSII